MGNRRLAKKGRYGDTHIRKVSGKKSHVNKREADMIDIYGLLGEILTKQQGAGTINPRTGLREYHPLTGVNKDHTHDEGGNYVPPVNAGRGVDSQIGDIKDEMLSELRDAAELETLKEGTDPNYDASGQAAGTEFFNQPHYVKSGDKWLKYIYQSGNLIPDGSVSELPANASEWATVEDMVDERNKTRDYGLESLSKEDFYSNGEPKSLTEIVSLLRDHVPEGTSDADIRARAVSFLPKLQDISGEETDFLEREYGVGGTEGGISGIERKLARDVAQSKKDRAGDVYDLGISAVGRQEEATEEAYTLGMSTAEREREAGLDPVRGQAGEAAAQMRSAYGSGSGASMRGAIAGQKKAISGAERVYGAFGDEQTRLRGTKARAEGAALDERERLLQAKTAAGEDFTFTKRDIGLDKTRDRLAYDKGIYGLGQEQESEFESSMASFLQGFKQGGRVPSKQTFLDVLTALPDAGGS